MPGKRERIWTRVTKDGREESAAAEENRPRRAAAAKASSFDDGAPLKDANKRMK
jgi:hypothetical protein